MIFGQLTNRDSLRDLIVAIDVHSKKSYILDSVKALPALIFQKQTRIGIAESLRSLPII